MGLPIGSSHLARIFRCAAHGVRCVCAQNIACPVCNLHLAIAAQQAPILLRFPI